MGPAGRTSPVGLVTWSTRAMRVRGVTAARIAPKACSGVAPGNGNRATATRAPEASATRAAAERQAP